MWHEKRHALGLWWQKLKHRAQQNAGLSFAFAFLGAVNSGVFIEMPLWILQREKDGASHFWWYWSVSFLVCFLSSLIIIFTLRVSVDRAAQLVRNPVRFVAVLSSAALFVSIFAWLVRQPLQYGELNPFTLPLFEYVDTWLQEMLWDGLIAWLYLLYLQRMEDRATFASLLARRAYLARQIAQSELLAVRAQVDPALLTRVLHAVHTRYPLEPESASALLDQLIAYLRLAMNRKRENVLTPAMQLAMDQALLVLNAAAPPDVA